MRKRASKSSSTLPNPSDGISLLPPKNKQTKNHRQAMRRLRLTIAALLAVLIVLIGITSAVYIHKLLIDENRGKSSGTEDVSDKVQTQTEATTSVSSLAPTKPAENTTGYETTSEPSQTTDMVPTVSVISPSSTPTPTPTQIQGGNIDLSSIDLTGYIVVLDPGHQLHANSEQEPVSPGSTETKDKVSAGTTGVATGRPEYEVNLEIALLMEDYLESLGCTVYLTRTENDVNISNVDRAEYAVSSGADVYIRLHCDGSSNPATRGIGVFVADSGTYVSSLVGWGDILGNSLSQTTGSVYRGCVSTDAYSGLNWATDIPSFLLEMGFMSNSTDDTLLSDPAYQEELCEGVALFVSQMPK